jgi:hypothetical protein
VKQRWIPVIFLLVVALIPFYKVILLGQQMGPTEHIQTMVTADAPSPDYGWDVLQADGVIQFLPWRDSVFRSWRNLEVPWINPYQLSGQPLAANSQSGAFYLPHFIAAFLPLSTVFKMSLLAWFHAFWAGLGIYFWTRHLGASRQAAAVAGVLVISSQFVSAWSPLSSVMATVSWIPWIFAGITNQDQKRGALTCLLSVLMMLTAGHLQFAAYGVMASLLYVFYQTIKTRNFLVVSGLLVGLVIAVPFVKPVLDYSQFSHRKNIPSEEGYQAYIKSSIQPFEMLSVVHPRLLGDPSGPTSLEKATGLPNGYWPLFIKQGANPAESALWLLPVSLVLIPLAFIGKKAWAAPLGVATLGSLLAFGTPLNRLLFFVVPGWSATGSPGRAHILLILGLVPLAALGYDTFVSKTSTGNKRWLGLAILPLLVLGVGFNLMNALGGILAQPGDDKLGAIINATTKPYLPMVAITSLLSSAWIAGIFFLKDRKLLIAALAVFTMSFPVLSGKPVSLPDTQNSTQERVAFVSRNWNIAQTPKAFMPPNIATLQKRYDLFGYDSILDGRHIQRLKEMLGKEPAPPENGNMMLFRAAEMTDESQTNLAKAGASAVSSPLGIKPLSNASLRVQADQGTAKLKEDTFGHQTIESDGKATEILIRDRYYTSITSSTPDVTVEGRDGFRLVKCKAGTKEIRLEYGPSWYRFAPLLILILTVGLGIQIIKKHEPNSRTTAD